MRIFYIIFSLGSLLMLLFVISNPVWGQSTAPVLSRFDRKVIPPSPEATQLGIFGNVLPDLNSGAVQLNVPLPAAKSRQLSLPLSLNYHYTGLQVGELPSWVGLGWTLSSGGVITRTVQGLPDEHPTRGYTSGGWQQLRLLRNRPTGMVQIHYTGQSQLVAPDIPLNNLCQQVLENQWDTEPDSYSISTPFYSGKLFVDSLGAITCSPHADVTISGAPDEGWTVTAGDGTQYIYQAPEEVNPSDDLMTPYGIAATAWYLSEIISADSSDHIQLVYGTQASGAGVPVNTIVKKVFSRSRHGSSCDSHQLNHLSAAGVSVGVFPAAHTTTISPYLQHIITTTTDIEFISDTVRRDVARLGDRSARRLTRIVYRELASGTAKADFVLTQSYFNAASTNPKERRLRLDAVREVGKPSYRFSYEGSSQPMPSRDSFAKDHWGYYNGQVQNRTLVPSVPPYLLALYGASNFQGGMRMANGTMARLGALREVQYPTGGRTSFGYEPNDVSKEYSPPTLAQQFGEATSMNCTTLRAMATGGSMSMGANALRFQAEHGGGQTDGMTLPSNVAVQIINAPNGFYMCNMEWDGNIVLPTIPGSTTDCNIGYEHVRTSLWNADYDSLEANYAATTQLCQVTYTANRCATITTSTCGSRMAQVYPPGDYLIAAEVSASNPAGIWASIAASIFLLPAPVVPPGPNSPPAQPRFEKVQVGGIRLRQATDWTAAGQATTKTFRYCAAGKPDESSGYLFVSPKYSYENVCGDLIVGASDVGKDNWLDVGYHVGYGRVEVESQGRQAGTTVYYYRNLEGELPTARNLVTKMEELSQTGHLVKETTNEYRLRPTGTVPGFRLYQDYNEIGTMDSSTPGVGGQFIRNVFLWLVQRSYTAYWPQLTTTTERVAGSGVGAALGLPSRTVHHYLPKAPGRTTQPVRTARYLSDGRQLITKTLYCGQYNLSSRTLTGVARSIKELAAKQMIGVPVEQQAWQRLGADSSVVGGSLTHFAQGRPSRILALATAAPVPASQFVSSYIQSNTLEQDPRYIERVAFRRYSLAGNPLEQQVTAAAPNSYLWGYNDTYLIAEAKSAAYNQIGYTSFEEAAAGNFRYNSAAGANGPRVPGGRTGNWAFRLGSRGQVSRDSLPAGNYELTLWAQSARPPSLPGSRISTPTPEVIATAPGGWHQFRWRISCQANAGFVISVWSNETPMLIDEVRLYPVGAHMTSYTYDPVLGMTSQTDPSGRTATYEYDTLGRLLRVRDEQSRIQTQQEYHYARP